VAALAERRFQLVDERRATEKALRVGDSVSAANTVLDSVVRREFVSRRRAVVWRA
jgi:hypothetical protein